MQSPLAGLCEVLKLVKASAENYREQLQRNEAVTRAVLVDPVLRALGWDIANPAMVEVERQAGSGNKFDYFLNGEMPVVVEAKKLGEPLEQHFMQIVRYAFTQDVAISGVYLTDGLKWIHYSNLSMENRAPANTINLGTREESDLAKDAAYFVQTLDAALIAPEHQKVEDRVHELEMKVNELQQAIISCARMTLIENSSPEQPQLSASQPITPEIRWQVIGDQWDAKKKKPVKMRLPDGQIMDVRSWTQVLVETCKFYLYSDTLHLQQLPISDRTGRETKLINNIKPPSNLNSDSFMINGLEVHVCTNYSANDAVANAAYLLGKAQGGAIVKPAVLLAE